MYSIQVPRRFTTSDWGGTETAVLQSSQQLVSRGHRVGIFTSMALAADARESVGGIEVRRFSHVYPFVGLAPGDIDAMDRKGGNLVSAALMRALLAEKDVSLFHAHSANRLGGMVRTAARLRRIPYVVSLHGGWFDLPAQSRQDLERPHRGRLEWGKALGWMLGSRRVLADAAAVICVGQNEFDGARRQLPGSRIEQLPNGVDVARFAGGNGPRFRRAFGIPESRGIVLNVGRIDPQKNQLRLIEAFARPELAGRDLHLALIGGVTDHAYHRAVTERIAGLGIGDRVTLIPGLAPQDQTLLDAYRAASMFCLPSVHEPFGIVALEAWAAGLPVIASTIGGLGRLVADGEDGLQVDATQAGEIAAAIAMLADAPELAARLAGAGHRKARDCYDWSVVGNQLVRLYEDVARH
jgi:glycosyltransferase involved in cell wall biosynthesis